MNGLPSNALRPTWLGHVSTTNDALILFEACLDGTLHHVPRRPHDRERSSLIKSGHVFIYEENASGIKRWTDGVPWSPSRILGNFLVYRELVKPFPPGEKKRAQKRPKNGRISKPGEPYPRRVSSEEQPSSGISVRTDSTFDSRENERALIGSLIDSYGFKEGGLVKKTMSIIWHGVHHHLVSYYNIEDVLEGTLRTPSKDPDLEHIRPRTELIRCQNFRAPLDDLDLAAQDSIGGIPTAYDYGPNSYKLGALMSPLDPHHQSSQLGLSAYGTGPLSTKLQTGLQSYVPASQATQSFFSSSNLAQSFSLKQEPYAPFNMPYPSAHGRQLSISQDTPIHHSPDQAVPSFRYRQDSIAHAPSRLNSLDSAAHMSDAKPVDSSHWSRSNSTYSAVTSPLNAAFPPGGPNSWPLAASLTQSIPRADDDWHATSHWSVGAGQDAPKGTNFLMPSQSG